VGGRTCTEKVRIPTRDSEDKNKRDTNNNEDEEIAVDVGGAYVGPTQDRILRVAKELSIPTYKVFTQGTR